MTTLVDTSPDERDIHYVYGHRPAIDGRVVTNGTQIGGRRGLWVTIDGKWVLMS